MNHIKIITFLTFLFNFFSTGLTTVKAENFVSLCENAYFATEYVLRDQYLITVNTDQVDAYESEILWGELHSAPLTVLQAPEVYASGGYVFNKGYQVFTVKGDLRHRLVLQNKLSILSDLDSVSVSCKYDFR